MGIIGFSTHMNVCLWSPRPSVGGPFGLSVRDQPQRMKGNDIITETQKERDELRPEYDFDYSKAVWRKCHKRLLKKGAKSVILEPDVAKAL
jgi:hypothetical protein